MGSAHLFVERWGKAFSSQMLLIELFAVPAFVEPSDHLGLAF
jgi:hypothetical protein